MAEPHEPVGIEPAARPAMAEISIRGERGSMGTSAVASAVCHATGRRVRDLPITADKLVPR